MLILRSLLYRGQQCKFEHSPYGDMGENIGTIASREDPSNIVNRWYHEVCAYDYSNPSFTAGHFTQVVWKSTLTIGCALVSMAWQVKFHLLFEEHDILFFSYP